MSSMHQKMRRITQLLNNRYSGVHRHGGDRPTPFKTLYSCVLSQRTRDVNAEKAAEALFTAAERQEDILKLGQERLRSLIRCSGFYNQKARYIIGICEALIGEFDGYVPEERDELLRLPA